MKKLLFILLFLIPVLSYGQKHVYFGPRTTIDSFDLTVWARQFKMATVPYINPYFDSIGSVYINTVTGVIYYHNGTGGGWQAITGGGGAGGLQHTGGWLKQTNDTVSFDSTNRVAYSTSDSSSLKLPTSAIVKQLLFTKLSKADSGTRYITPYAFDTTFDYLIGVDSYLAQRIDSSINKKDSGTVYTTPTALAAKVPYAGATQAVNLGSYSLTSNRVNVDTVKAKSSMGLHLHGTGGTGIMVGAGGGGNITFDAYPTTTTGDSVLSTNSAGAIMQYSLKWKLSNYALTSALSDSVSGRMKQSDTVGLSNRINLKLNFSDTAGLSARINLKLNSSDTAGLSARINLKLNSSDTAGLSARINLKLNSSDTAGLSARINLKLNASDTALNVVTNTSIRTLSKKRWEPRVISAASYTTSVTIPADSIDLFAITAQAGALLFNAPSGTPNNGDIFVIRIKDNGTPRALTYNAVFNWSPPSTTITSKWLVMCFMWNGTTSNWNFMWKRDEP